MTDCNALTRWVLGFELERGAPLPAGVVPGPYRAGGPDLVTAAWEASDDVAAMVRALRLRGPLSNDTIMALVDAGVPPLAFIIERAPTHRAVRDAAVAARVRAIVAAPTTNELLAMGRS